jgi:non-ribosomal peptide synthetase component F
MRRTARPAPAETGDAAADDTVSTVSGSDLSLHDLFEQQARHWLDRADVDEEQKQTILAALSCPCCGSGGMSFTVKVKE